MKNTLTNDARGPLTPDDEVMLREVFQRRVIKLPTEGMDQECVELCEALNLFDGIQTVESCCGHEKDPYRIWFFARAIEDLAPICYWFDNCHIGFRGWSITVYTDCAMQRARFMIEGPKGPEAYEQAKQIAAALRKEL